MKLTITMNKYSGLVFCFLLRHKNRLS